MYIPKIFFKASAVLLCAVFPLCSCDLSSRFNERFLNTESSSFPEVSEASEPPENYENDDFLSKEDAVDIALTEIIENYFEKYFEKYDCSRASDFFGYIINAFKNLASQSVPYYLESSLMQNGNGEYYYMIHLYQKIYDAETELYRDVTVNRYLITFPDIRIIPMLDHDGNPVEEYNDIII